MSFHKVDTVVERMFGMVSWQAGSSTSFQCRALQQGTWEQAQSHLISLFRQQSSDRVAASQQLAAQLGLTEALQQLAGVASSAQVAQDPFCKLLDGGVSAQVTAACASRISSSFRSDLTELSAQHE